MSLLISTPDIIQPGGAAFPAGMNHTWDAALGYAIETGVSLWEDQSSDIDVTQPATGKQPARTAVNAGLNNQPSIDGDKIDDILFSPLVDGLGRVNEWHDGTGVTIYLACFLTAAAAVAETILASTSALSSSAKGLILYMTTPGKISLYIPRAVAPPAVNSTVTCAPGKCSIIIQHGTARTPNWEFYRNGISLANGAYAGAPSVLDSGVASFHALNAGTAYPGNAQIGLIHAWPDPAVSVAAIQAAHEARFGT